VNQHGDAVAVAEHIMRWGQEAAFRAGVGASGALAGVCGNEPISRGIYQLQFALTKAELWVRYGWSSSVMVNVG
jgi:hypothetical protein